MQCCVKIPNKKDITCKYETRNVVSSISHLARNLVRSFTRIVFYIYFSCFDPQHKADKGEIRKQKALSKEYEDMLQEYKNQVDREQ